MNREKGNESHTQCEREKERERTHKRTKQREYGLEYVNKRERDTTTQKKTHSLKQAESQRENIATYKRIKIFRIQIAFCHIFVSAAVVVVVVFCCCLLVCSFVPIEIRTSTQHITRTPRTLFSSEPIVCIPRDKVMRT